MVNGRSITVRFKVMTPLKSRCRDAVSLPAARMPGPVSIRFSEDLGPRNFIFISESVVTVAVVIVFPGSSGAIALGTPTGHDHQDCIPKNDYVAI